MVHSQVQTSQTILPDPQVKEGKEPEEERRRLLDPEQRCANVGRSISYVSNIRTAHGQKGPF